MSATIAVVLSALLALAASQTINLCCPKVTSGGVGICVESCNNCAAYGKLCCPNGCGHVCTTPVPCTTPTTTPRTPGPPSVTTKPTTVAPSLAVISNTYSTTNPCSTVRCASCTTCTVVNGLAACIPNAQSTVCPCCCPRGICISPLPNPCTKSPTCTATIGTIG